jgi:hypothetical protein
VFPASSRYYLPGGHFPDTIYRVGILPRYYLPGGHFTRYTIYRVGISYKHTNNITSYVPVLRRATSSSSKDHPACTIYRVGILLRYYLPGGHFTPLLFTRWAFYSATIYQVGISYKKFKTLFTGWAFRIEKLKHYLQTQQTRCHLTENILL